MSPAIGYAIMLFGAAVAVAGLALLFLRGHDAAESSFEIFGQKIRLTSTGLAVLIVGCSLVFMPLYLHIQPQNRESRQIGDPPPSRLGIYLPDRIDGEEAEPNDTTQQANRIEIGQTYISHLVDSEDIDFFVFTLPPDGPTRLQVEALWHTSAEHVAVEMRTAYGRKLEGGNPSGYRHNMRQRFTVEPDNAYYLTLHLTGAEFPFVYELRVSAF
jgi:hypothetical protein